MHKLAVLVLALGVWGAVADGAMAASWVVNTTSDVATSASECQGASGDCSLRQAIDKAGAGDTVALGASITPYAVTLGQLWMSRSLTISGAGARTTRIAGDGSSGIFYVGAPASSAVTISGLTISHGTSATSGGAIQIASPGATVDLNGVRLTDNAAVGSGGAVKLTGGTLNVTASTIGPGNVASGGNGGAIDNDGATLTVTDSTVSANSAAGGGSGGGVSTEGGGSTTLQHATIAFNSASGSGAMGGNLYSNNPGNVPVAFTVSDTIVAAGAAPSGAECGGGGFVSSGHNATDGISATGTAGCGFTQPTDVLGDVRLGPLEDNGGQTQTEALAAGSPAIDQIPRSDPGCPLGSDQRGVGRPVAIGCDIGALEAGGGESAPQWNASHDFRTSPQANPSPDRLGHSGVWSYLEAPLANLHQPATYSLMSESGVAGGCPNLNVWGDVGGLPDVIFNDGGTTDVCYGTVTVPAYTLAMHPSASTYAIVAWTSPTAGMIDVAGSFTSMDPNGGSGTTWYVDKGSTNVAAGANTAGGAGNFELSSVTVSAGEVLYFILGPAANGDYTYDTTAFGLTITQAASAASCQPSITLDAVQVLADCISPQSGGSFLASGHTRFSNGTSIVVPGTQTPAALVIDPASHKITLAPAADGSPQTGELQANGVDVARGQLAIDTRDVQDPVSAVAGTAAITGIASVDFALSGWTFGDLGIMPTAHLVPSGASGGGVVVDGQLALPAWLGPVLAFGPLGSGFPTNVSGQLAVQVDSAGRVSVVNGGISFQRTLLGIPALKLEQAQIQYQRAGDVWSGQATLGTPNLVGLTVNAVIGQGKLDSLDAYFACSSSGNCGGPAVQTSTPGGPKVPTIGAVLDIKDASLHVINLQGISYTPPPTSSGLTLRTCVPGLKPCPAPPPAPQIKGAVIVGALGDKVIAGGGFTYLLSGAFSASGTVGLAPLYGGKFPAPAALQKFETAQSVVNTMLKTAHTGVELANAQVQFTPPHLLQASGTLFLPPPPFPLQFLKGTISIGIAPPHFTGQGSLDMVVPSFIPLIGGKSFGGVQGLISDKGAAAKASLPQVCVKYIGCTPTVSVLVAFNYQSGSFTFNVGGGSINDYATVPQGGASSAAAGSRRTLRVPDGKQLASFTIRSARGTPDVQLTSPPGDRHRRRLTLATSKRLRNHSGALAWINKAAHSETFLVYLPSRGRWTVKRLGGPRINSVKVTVPRHKLRASSSPQATPRANDLPKRTVSTNSPITLHYDVPHAQPGTTVDLWAGTGPHGAGGVMIAQGLPPSGSAKWKLTALGSGRYWPYAIVNQKGVPVSISYWPDSVDLADPAAPAAPARVQAALNSGQAYVAWNEVPAAATYAITATPAGSGAAVRDAVPASQLADQLTLAPGKWSLTVQAVDTTDRASLPSAGSIVTVP